MHEAVCSNEHSDEFVREAVSLVRRLQTSLLEQRDVHPVLASFAENVTWFGSGEHEFYDGLEQSILAMQHDVRDYPGNFVITRDSLQGRQVSDDICIVFGEIFAKAADPNFADLHIRISVLCHKTAAGLRLEHMHFSCPDLDLEDPHAYVRRHVEQEREQLKATAAEALQLLREHHAELEALNANIPGGVCQCLPDDGFTLLNMSEGLLNLVGYTREDIRTLFLDRFADIIFAEDRPHVLQSLHEQWAKGDTVSLEYRIQRKDGQMLWILDKGKLVTMSDGTQNFFCIMLDITAQRAEQNALRLSLDRHQIIMNQTSDVIFEWDFASDTLALSANWRKRYGYEPIKSNIMRDLVTSGDIFSEDTHALLELMANLRHGEPYQEAEIRMRSEYGYIWSRIRATTQFDSAGQPIKAVGVIVDIDQEKKRHQELEAQAHRDQLTGLLNKVAGQNRVIDIMHSGVADSGVFLIIDLDDFKQINDLYGHLSGDTVLADVGNAISHLFRSLDVTARIGGDEFMVYMPGMGATEACKKAAAVVEAIANVMLFGVKGQVQCSVGAALFPHDATNFYSLYHCADVALYHVKKTGKSNFAFYNATRDAHDAPGAVDTCATVAFSAVGAPIDSEGRLVKNQLGSYCFNMLYHSIQPETAVRQLLEIVGRTNNVSRVYIFESSDDGQRCSNTFEWCNTDIVPAIDSLQNLDYDNDLNHYQEQFDENGVFYCHDTASLVDPVRSILDQQGVTSTLQCAIKDEGTFCGFVGFDQCDDKRKWTPEHVETLSLVANVLSTFLLKLRLKERLARLQAKDEKVTPSHPA